MKRLESGTIDAKQIFLEYNNIVYGFVLKNVASEAIAKDITQDIFLKVCLNIERISEIHDVDNYVFLITRNTLIDHFRRAATEKKYRETLKEKWMNPIDREIDKNHYESILNSALDQLPERQKTIYLLHRKEGIPLEDIARDLDISFYTAKNHLAEARKKLRKLIDPNILSISVLITLIPIVINFI